MPYQRNLLFTGRDEILTQLHERFIKETSASSKQPLVLSGLGGMGKTQLALEYAYRYREEYRHVLWAKADSQEVLASELASFAALLNVPGKREQDQQYALDGVKRWLELHTSWLLILDNIEDLKLAREYLPTQPQGHILFTARTQVTRGIAYPLEVEALTLQEGALLLLRRIGHLAADAVLEDAAEVEYTGAIKIVEMLGGLPLAIDQAGSYMEETGASLQRYQEIYARRRFDLLKKRGDSNAEHPESVITTLSLSFEKVAKSNPAALELLHFLVFLHPDVIPEELLEKGALHLGPSLQEVVTDPFALDQALTELRKYSLIRRNPHAATLTLHRLVQDVLKDSLDETVQRQWAERAIRTINHMFPQVELVNWPVCQQYLPQAQICPALIETWHFIFPEATHLLHQAGRYLHARGQYAEAASFIAQALALREQTLGSNHLDVAECLHDLAETNRLQGRYVEAEPFHKRALTIREDVLGPDHPDVATSLNNLARPYHHQGRYAEAEPLYKRALAIREQTLGLQHPDVAQSLNDLAVLYTEQGRYAEVESLYKRALVIREQTLGLQHPDVAQSLSNLASFYDRQDRYTSEALHKRALAIDEQVLGPHHPDTATNLNNLALFYSKQGRYAEAEPLYKRALAIREQVLGPYHPDTATSLSYLALFYGKRGRYAEAEPLFKRALAIQEQVFGPHHPNTATTLSYLALHYANKRNYKRAESLFKRALNICKQKLEPEHPITGEILQNYLTFLRATNQKEKAAEVAQRIKIRK